MSASPTEPLRILELAIKPAHQAPMKKVLEARAIVDGGLEGATRPDPSRGLTFVASRQWEQVQRELGADISWHLRRANVLVEADHLRDWLGRRIRVGQAVVEITEETKPCWLMEAQCKGLLKTLVPEMRGGVLGRIVTGGMIYVGDTITVLDETPPQGE